MTQASKPPGDSTVASLSGSQRALLAARLRASKDAASILAAEPIAIVGMACRFPGGANDPDALWELLARGGDAIREPPPGRFPASERKDMPRWGGYIEGVDQFDPGFFGISPREAHGVDPQQRLLLEVAWEALERAGMPREQTAGSAGGVFIGMYNSDYSLLQLSDADRFDDVHLSVGFSAAANRLSYLLDLHGPSMVVDTACSSALLAVHLACQSLRAGECNMALAGGVNLILRPALSRAYHKWGMLAPDGRCKVFDRRADGYVRSEGCGIVVLRRLSDALGAGDPILALIYGSAVGQDGRTQSATAPNGRAQEVVLRQALAAAAIPAEQVTYVEAHGTGTSLGDPIEFGAIRGVYGAQRPCVLGAVKANIGHLEAAAGVAGLMKAVLVLQHQAIPPQVHFQAPNPHLGLEGTSFRIPTTLLPWTPEGPRYAGVSSFGAGGTNVHMIVGAAPSTPQPRPDDGRAHLFTLSARDPNALTEAVRHTASHLRSASAGLGDLSYTANLRRSHHDHRLALVAASRAELAEQLTGFAAGQAVPGLSSGRAEVTGAPRVVFVFPGQGGQWVGMGRKLMAEAPVFRQALEACDAAMRPHWETSVIAELTADGDAAHLDRIDIVQPVLFALQVALAALWRHLGVVPDAVVGQSMGEVAAAHVAGALSLTDAARIICARSRILRRVSGRGAMAVLGLPLDAARQALAGRERELSVAASNNPRATVVAGEPEALEALLAELAPRNIFCRRIKVDVASHSPQMDPLRPILLDALAGLRPGPAAIPIHSTVTGAPIDGSRLDAEYWVRNLREPVLLWPVVQDLLAADHRLFFEIGPHPILDGGDAWTIVPSMRRGEDERRVLLEALGRLYAAGGAVAFGGLHPQRGQVVNLPTYPWQHARYWLRGLDRPRPAAAAAAPVEEPLPDGSPDRGWLTMEWRIDPGLEEPRATVHETSRPWLVLADRGGVGAALAEQLARAGIGCISIAAGQPVSHQGVVLGTVSPDEPASLDHLVAKLREARIEPAAVVHLWALDTSPGASGIEPLAPGCAGALHLVQALVRHPGAVSPRLWLVTRGAQPVGSDSVPAEGVFQAPLWGLGRVVAQEHPELWGGLVDLAPQPGAGEAAALARLLTTSGAGAHVALRGDRVHRGALAPTSLEERDAAELPVRGDGSYLITGGLGGLGLELARWLVERGARRLVLLGRRGPSPAATAAIAALEARGATVRSAQVDVADAGALEALLASVPDLRGVIHAAAVLEDSFLKDDDWSRFRRVLAPKVAGAWNLHRLTSGRELDFFVLFSSAAALLGPPGQGNYAAANAFLDALAHHRRAQGLAALSINWGAWSGVGLVSGSERTAYVSAYGLRSMPPEEALAAFGCAMGADVAQVAILPADWRAFFARIPRDQVPAWLTGLAPSDQERAASSGGAPWIESLRDVPPPERHVQLLAFVRRQVAAVLGFDEDRAPDPERGLFELGMNSLMAVELRRRLQDALGRERTLRSTAIFDHPTIVGLTRYLAEDVLGWKEEAAPATAPAAPPGADLLRRVEGLSSEELERLLTGEGN